MKYNMDAKNVWLMFKIHIGMWIIALFTVNEARDLAFRSINAILNG